MAASGLSVNPAAFLSDEQERMVGIIEREFRAAGFGPAVAAAAVANAYAESRLNPRAQSPAPEDSVGLFQLNIRGAGSGMTTAERMDPVLNTRRIIDVARRSRDFMAVVREQGSDVGALTEAFCVYIERPAMAWVKGAERRALAAWLFPRELVAAVVPGKKAAIIAASIAAAALLGVAVWRYREPLRRQLAAGR